MAINKSVKSGDEISLSSSAHNSLSASGIFQSVILLVMPDIPEFRHCGFDKGVVVDSSFESWKQLIKSDFRFLAMDLSGGLPFEWS